MTKPFWTRRKTAVAALASGLFLGYAAADGGSDESAASAPSVQPAEVSSSTDDTDGLQQQIEELQAQLEQASADAAAERQAAVEEAVKQAVKEARKDERAKAAASIEAAEAAAAEASRAAAASKPRGFAGTGEAAASSATDPRFGTCTEAIGHGYGPYVEGKDPEYDWYIDRDGDGRVCE